MNRKISIRIALLITIAALGALSSLAQSSPHNNEWSPIRSANTNSPALAPWFIDTVDSTNDVGQHVSLAIDPENGTTYISYYNATNDDLRMATFVGTGGNCGPDNTRSSVRSSARWWNGPSRHGLSCTGLPPWAARSSVLGTPGISSLLGSRGTASASYITTDELKVKRGFRRL